MKIIRNNIIPFKGFKAINLFGVLFVRNDSIITERTIRHEEIHTAQIKELLFFFYLLYLLEWFVKLFKYGRNAYDNISFEREAYQNEDDLDYLKKRSAYSFFKYIINN